MICLGPKTQSPEKLGQLIEAGMNVMRMNFSHGTHEVSCLELLPVCIVNVYAQHEGIDFGFQTII